MMLAENVVELTIASQLEFIDLVTALTDNITQMVGFDEEASYWINMAVRESVANAIEHGNKYDSQKAVDIRFTVGVDALRVTVRDYGEGFDPGALPDPLDPDNILNPAGRGILYMRTFMDSVEYTRHPESGMVVSMTKRRMPKQTDEGDSRQDAVRN
ncbi:MAG: ATP-binding protein [Acidobacteria bacterium]|nr:ATP-binding protein [Acidobacteriota bacterium]MCW5967316.1 ATP-binding protein [Blastocatellales bacterium]